MSSYSDGDVYEVEAIRKRRIYNGKIQYYIKWKNFPEVSNTWEDEENLDGCRELLAEFLKQQVLKKKQEKKKKPVQFLKVTATIEVDGAPCVTFLCSDKTHKTIQKNNAISHHADLYFDYLEKRSAFRVETEK